jgi:hypothetical protein
MPRDESAEMLHMTRKEVAEFGALCVANSQRRLTARQLLEEYLEYHPAVMARASSEPPKG